MPTWRDVVAIARTLPETTVGTWYGTPGLKVGGKGFGRFRAESDGGVVMLCSLDEKARLLASGDPAFYTTPHYDGYGSILVNLSHISLAALRERIILAWRMKAAKRLAAMFDEAERANAARSPARTPARPPSRTRR